MNHISPSSKIIYRTDAEQGRSFSTEFDANEFGWVEYCLTKGDLYVCDNLPNAVVQQLRSQAIASIKQSFMSNNVQQLGFVQHLSETRLKEPWLLPLFAHVSATGEFELAVGRSRACADFANGFVPERVILFAPKGHDVSAFGDCKPLTSTPQFDQLFDLKYIDYEIGMSENSGELPQFLRSVIRHSIYDKQDPTLPHINIGTGVYNYWQKNIKNYGKIVLEVRCTEAVARLIQPSEIFQPNIIIEKDEDWVWSYGRLMGSYRKNESPLKKLDLHLWLFDVAEPVHLELLMPWVHHDITCFYSDNKKSVLFDTSDVTSMQIIGDWVK